MTDRYVYRHRGTEEVTRILWTGMFHFKKDEEAFTRFALEKSAGNPKLIELKTVGVDMESAIYQGFKSNFKDLPRCICVRHLQQRDERKIEKLLERTNKISPQKKKSKYKISKDLYGEQCGTYYEYGLAESLDADNFQAKFFRRKVENSSTWISWFLKHQKVFLEESMIQSVCISSNVEDLYYQNDIESQYSVQKRIQEYKKRDVATVRKNLSRLSDRQDTEEVRALYGAANYSIARPCKRFCIQNSEWHSWDDN